MEVDCNPFCLNPSIHHEFVRGLLAEPLEWLTPVCAVVLLRLSEGGTSVVHGVAVTPGALVLIALKNGDPFASVPAQAPIVGQRVANDSPMDGSHHAVLHVGARDRLTVTRESCPYVDRVTPSVLIPT